MSTELTHQTITTYLRTLIERGAYGSYFAPDVTFTIMGTGMKVTGQAEVEQFIRSLHEQAFDAHPAIRHTIVAATQAVLEADFVGVHTGEFFGVAASGRHVSVPYAVVYDLADGAITALRAYLPLDILLQQIGATTAAVPSTT